MKAVVVYESMFGNTRSVAEAIAQGLRQGGGVVCGSVDEVSPAEAAEAVLLVAGGPTHAHGMARPNAHEEVTRAKSYRKYGPVLPGRESLRGWLDRLPAGAIPAAAFDTRFDKPRWLTGSAALKIARRMRAKGMVVLGEQSFFVETTGGPLAPGERERAVAWGRSLAASIEAELLAG